MAKTAPTVFIVDDDHAMRELLRSLVSSVGLPVETFATGHEFLAAQNGGRPGCLIVDLCMPGMSGLDLLQELAARKLRIPVIMISGYGDVSTAVRALQAGAIDFLEKPLGRQLLLERLRHALELDRKRRRAEADRARVAARVARLTPREREVMGLVLAGKTNQVIAIDLNLSEKTVEVLRAHVMQKMKVDCVAELLRMALLIPTENAS